MPFKRRFKDKYAGSSPRTHLLSELCSTCFTVLHFYLRICLSFLYSTCLIFLSLRAPCLQLWCPACPSSSLSVFLFLHLFICLCIALSSGRCFLPVCFCVCVFFVSQSPYVRLLFVCLSLPPSLFLSLLPPGRTLFRLCLKEKC